MAFFCGLFRLRQIPCVPIPFYQEATSSCYSLLLYPTFRSHFFSGRRSGSATAADFPTENAYHILGVSETSSFSQIKDSFRRLAKQTHPDLLQSSKDPSASKRFVQILAAYEILSDSKKRAHYDSYLLSQRKLVQKHSREQSLLHTVESYYTTNKEMEVVEWLKWYRLVVNDIVSNRKVVVGTGYLDVLEADFYSAVHAAYYGPSVESMDLLPDRFEAEERSVYETPEVLHLVSGRSLFGMVCLGNKCAELSPEKKKLTSFRSNDHALCQSTANASGYVKPDGENDAVISKLQATESNNLVSDAYKDLELHVSGKLVARASRVPPKSTCNGIVNQDSDDHIHIFLNSFSDPMENVDNHPKVGFSGSESENRSPLATIVGLGTSPQEGLCFVYNSSGTKTHVIMKHRTLLVKHMHYYWVGEKVSVCECRCSRARLPPSRFWLFEPRCGMHDIGGWYIETFGRDKKGRIVASQRWWDGLDTMEHLEERLHPSVYLLSLAYRTLDIEDARRKKRTIRSIVEGNLSRMLDWCQRII